MLVFKKMVKFQNINCLYLNIFLFLVLKNDMYSFYNKVNHHFTLKKKAWGISNYSQWRE